MTLGGENEKAKNASTQECPSAEESNATLGNDAPGTPGIDYPGGLRLISLIVGLGLAVLLVALVSIVVYVKCPPCLTIGYRTTQSLRLLYLEFPMTSSLLTT